MKKKLLITLIAVCTMLFSFCIINASAETVANGECGDTLTWILDDTGTLIISGHGDMNDWSLTTLAPWYSSEEYIIKVVIEDGVTTIGSYAFAGCESLVTITIPDSVTSIGELAFVSCESLASITIPNSITSIGSEAFSYCNSLASITIPDGVTSIGYATFEGCNNLASISIPDSVIHIDEYAFKGCSSLVSIIIPDTITSIGDWAFSYCNSLANVTIGEGVTEIGRWIFKNCNNLTSITFGDNITSIGVLAFDGCGSLANVYYNGTKEAWNKISIHPSNTLFSNVTIHYKQEHYYINDITIKDMLGNELSSIPTGTFLATVSFTNVSSSEDTVIILAQYTEAGAFKGLMYVQTEDVPTGSTMKLSIPVDNTNGDIAQLKAFCWESFGSATPLGNSVSFPAK